jgi:uracil-DNA glycosylase
MHAFPENWLTFAQLDRSAIPTIGETAYPPAAQRFKALELVAPEEVRVVILGQDPYHGEGEAHGLAFSVPEGIATPPSLRNIFQELSHDLGIAPPQQTDLTRWAKQGVLLLNSVLTVSPNQAASHRDKGWEKISDAIIQSLGSVKAPPCAFLLWGKFAQKKKIFIHSQRHFIIESVHPSPLSAYRGFWGSRPFSRINHWLEQQNSPPIHWA